MSEPSVTNQENNTFFSVRYIFSPLFVTLMLAASPAGFAADLVDMLERMSSVSQSRNYQGTFILRKSDQLSTLRVHHGMDERGVWESLEALSGEPRTVIRQNNQVVSIFPEKKLLTVRHAENGSSLHQKLPENIKQLNQYYFFKRLDDDRIAGYKTLVLDLEPKDPYRYGYRYWLEKDSGMLLRCDLLDTRGDVVEQMMFTELEYLEQAPEMAFTEMSRPGFTVKNLDDESPHAKDIAWEVTRLPDGFELIQSHYRLSASPPLLQLVYSDSLASVSVFIEKMDGAASHLEGPSARGALHAYGVQIGEYYITVVGEVPAATVKQMAESTQQRQQDD
ncbi:MAG TPA: hypothetical protein ENJ64_06920 [Thiotrichales bacterium]|nr:hypothetical protein [Thiotrichales bacterium]